MRTLSQRPRRTPKHTLRWLVAGLVALLAVPPTARSEGGPALRDEDVRVALVRTSPRVPRSAPAAQGWAWRGRLRDSRTMVPNASIHLVGSEAERGFHFGTPSLVGLLERVASQIDGARLQVGELSRLGGGRIVGHRSHQNGRDVDLGFYFLDDLGQPVDLSRFVNVRGAGVGNLDGRRLRFDDTRNWQLIAALVTDTQTPVQHIFVHSSVRARLLREGRRLGASREVLERVERMVMLAGTSNPHRNHFHVRIYCSATDVPRCRDRGPFWPWIDEAHPWHAKASPIYGFDRDTGEWVGE